MSSTFCDDNWNLLRSFFFLFYSFSHFDFNFVISIFYFNFYFLVAIAAIRVLRAAVLLFKTTCTFQFDLIYSLFSPEQ